MKRAALLFMILVGLLAPVSWPATAADNADARNQAKEQEREQQWREEQRERRERMHARQGKEALRRHRAEQRAIARERAWQERQRALPLMVPNASPPGAPDE